MQTYLVFALSCLLAFIALSIAAKEPEKQPSNYTVTDEAWFEVEVKDLEGKGKHYKGRFTIALFGEVVPMTVLNFASLARGYKRGRHTIGYKGTPVHRVVKDFVIQMGDTVNGDGTGGRSIYGDTFIDENFVMSHKGVGMVAMANYGRDTNGSQFYILLTKARWLDGKHVVFGKVVRGMDVVKVLGEVRTHSRTAIPVYKINITDSGLNYLDRKYTLTDTQLEQEDDL